ncbi:GNAT family N-acetyltransferase [Pantoea sp. S61]|uniref:GNAT family N-acetyltransferase n=1 Tax=Pantoea sp. S61 TaxID=2767442 RepID=UPI001F34ABCB|nr:GNAT family N-acetyltransferase [Pantoea sp. S61]
MIDTCNSSHSEKKYTVEIFDTLKNIGKETWNTLKVHSEASVFYNWDFIDSIEKNPLTKGAKAYYLLFKDIEDKPFSVLTLYLQTTLNPFDASALEPERMLIGHFWHCYDTKVLTNTIIDSEFLNFMRDQINALAYELNAKSCGLCNIVEQSEFATSLGAAGFLIESGASRYSIVPNETLNLNQHLKKSVGRSSRRTLNHYIRRSKEAGVKITFESVSLGLTSDVLELCLATADKHAKGYYPPLELAILLKNLGDSCKLLKIELNGKLLAVSICLLDEESAHFWAGGALYPKELNWSPQYVLFAAEIEYGFMLGKRKIEFGRRNDEFKLRFGLTPIPLANWVWSVTDV